MSLEQQIDAAAAPEAATPEATESPSDAQATEVPAEGRPADDAPNLRTFDSGPSEADLIKEMEALGETPPEKPLDIATPEDDPDDVVPHEDPDADLNKRLEAIQAEEKRAKQSIAAEFEKLEAERGQLQGSRADIEKRLERFESLSSRVYDDPSGVLSALGLEEGDFEAAARHLYAMSPKGKEDPRLRGTAAETLRSRNTAQELRAVRDELKELRQERVNERDAATNATHAREFLASATAAIGDKTPLAAVMQSKNPAKLTDRLATLTQAVYSETGEVPEPAALVAEFEKRYRAELEDAGIDTTLIGQTKQAPPVQAATKKAPTLTNQLSTPTTPRAEPLDADELQADILKEMEALTDPE